MNLADWVQGRSVNERGSEEKKRNLLEIEEMSEVSNGIVKNPDLEADFQLEGTGENVKLQPNINTTSRVLDVNGAVGATNFTDNDMKVRRWLDLNVDNRSSCLNEPFQPSKTSEGYSFSKDDSEHSSFVIPSKEMASYEARKNSKKNNYMYGSSSGMTVGIPKARGKNKSDSDSMKKRTHISKRQRADTVSRLAAPSGLLNGLNPGILNHVRNSKQVRSIIENILKSESRDNQLSGSTRSNQIHSTRQELVGRKELGNTGCPRAESSKDVEAWEGNTGYGDGKLPTRLTSSMSAALENRGCMANDELDCVDTVSSLSAEAAKVAVQWLELLNYDIRGRLAALKQSKKRLSAAIHTELPLLLQSEFSSNLQSDTKDNICYVDQAMADAQLTKWRDIFMQMQNALDEEETILESWLNQIQQVQLHCEKGLNRNRGLEKMNSMEAELTVRAAAASMYSMCNYLLSA